MADQRSPFGELLRYHRRRLGMSQERLAEYIVELGEAHPDIAALGVISEKAIANLEMRRHDPAMFVRPRPATVRLLSAIFDLKPGTPDYTAFWRASGLDEPAESEATVELTPALAPLGTGERVPRERPAFVTNGREIQLARIVGAVDDALTGQPRVCFVSGEPGIGKTSLLAEAARRAVAAHPELVVIWSECTGKFGATDAFQPLRQALNIMIGDTRAASPPQLISVANQDRLRQRAPAAIQVLASVGDALVERFISAESVIAQGDALGIRPGSWQTRLRQLAHRPPSAQSSESDEQFVRLLQRYAEDGPVMLVIEDLHWANHDLTRAIFHLLRRLRGQTAFPFVIAGSFRPTELEQHPDAGRHPMAALIDEAYQMFETQVVDLAPTVGSGAGRAFVNGIVDREANDVGPAFRDLLFSRTSGHPYFTLELLRWFRNHGALTQDAAGIWHIGTIPADRAIPEGITAVIRARLGPLPAELHRLLRLASAQGEVFSLEVLAAVMGRDPDELGELVDSELIRRHQLVGDGGAVTIAGQRLHQYRFGHALFQEYLYTSLTAVERERFHAQTGTAMLILFGGGTHEAAADIAVQFDRAGRPREAAAAYKEAGDHSTEMLEFQTASRFYRRAVELAEQESLIGLAAQCSIGLANCAREMGDPVAAGEQAEMAIALARTERLSQVEGAGLFVQGLLDYDGGRYARAAARLAAAIPLLEQHGDDDDAGRARTFLSHVLYGRGAYDEALRQAQESALVAERLHNDWLAIDAEVAAANCQTDLGLFREAIETYTRGATRARAIGHRRALGLCLVNTGLSRLEQGEWELAVDSLDATLALTNDGSMPRTRATAEFYLALVAEGRGDYPLAAHLFTHAIELRHAAGQEVLARDAIAGQLRVAIADGNLPRVRHLHTQLVQWIDEHGVSGIEFPVRLYISLYRAELALGDDDTASQWLDAAQALLAERASHIADEAARRSYLEQVPAHRELNRLLQELPAHRQGPRTPVPHADD